MTNYDRDIVEKIAQEVRVILGENNFQLWFEDRIQFQLNEAKDSLTLWARNRFVKDWVQRNYLRTLRKVTEDILGKRLAIELIENPEIFPKPIAEVATDGFLPGIVESIQESRVVSQEKVLERRQQRALERREQNRKETGETVQLFLQTMTNALDGTPGKKRRTWGTFQTLVEGKFNRLACTMARMILERQGDLSLMVVYGAPGMGKTHLLDAIRYDATERGMRVEAETAEAFTAKFIHSIRTDADAREEFRERYRSPDIFILDGIQFLQGKTATIAEVLSVITEIQRDHRRVIFSCDRPLEELDRLSKDFLSYLRGGVWCLMSTPEYESRLQIVRQMAQQRNLTLSEEVCKAIARRFTGDIREMVGALNTLQILSKADRALLGFPSEERGSDSLEGFLSSLTHPTSQPVRLDEIRQVVCEVFGITPDALTAGGRTRRVSQPRMLAMWLARKYTRHPFTEIGQFFGCTSHSSVISAQKKVNDWIANGTSLQTARKEAKAEEVLQSIESRLHTL